MVILASQSGDFARDKGRQVAETLLQAHPDATIVYAHNDEMALGAIAAIEAAGKVPGKDILVVSIDGEKDALQAIADGKLGCSCECNPRFGPAAFDILYKYAAGETIPPLDHQPGPLLRRQQRRGGPADRLLSRLAQSLAEIPPACFAAGGRALSIEARVGAESEPKDAMPSPAPLLVMRDIDKRFQGVHALAKASLEVQPGEIMALVGQNGAGKSTLIKVLTGAYSRDAGSIDFAGRPIAFASPQEAQRGGDQHHLPGDQPRPVPLGDREHLPRPRASPLRPPRLGPDERGGGRAAAALRRRRSTSAGR